MFIYADTFPYYHSSAYEIMSRLQILALRDFQTLILIYCSNLTGSAFPFLSLLTLFALIILAFLAFFFFSKYNYCTVPAIFIFQNPFPPSIPTQIVPLSFRHLSYNSGTALPCLTHPAGQVTWVPQNWTWKAIDKFQTKLKGSQIAIPVRHYIFLDAFMLVHRFVLWNMLGGYF